MSLWWHTEDTCFLACAHACARTQTHKFLMGSGLSTGVEFTKAALEKPIYSVQPPQPTTRFSFHFTMSLLLGAHRATNLPTGIKAYINSRGLIQWTLLTLQTLQVACPHYDYFTLSVLINKTHTRVIALMMQVWTENWCACHCTHYTAVNDSFRSEGGFNILLTFICCEISIKM